MSMQARRNRQGPRVFLRLRAQLREIAVSVTPLTGAHRPELVYAAREWLPHGHSPAASGALSAPAAPAIGAGGGRRPGSVVASSVSALLAHNPRSSRPGVFCFVPRFDPPFDRSRLIAPV